MDANSRLTWEGYRGRGLRRGKGIGADGFKGEQVNLPHPVALPEGRGEGGGSAIRNNLNARHPLPTLPLKGEETESAAA